MTLKLWLPPVACAALAAMAWFPRITAMAGETPSTAGYKVLDPIRHGNLTVFPVVAATSHDTHEFLTLDEGVRSGEVVVTEYGNVQPLMRRREHSASAQRRAGQPVGAGEQFQAAADPAGRRNCDRRKTGSRDRERPHCSGGERSDRPECFCVEPGRWTATSAKFGSMGSAMAQPAVRAKAMAAKDQQQVWEQVRKQQAEMASNLEAAQVGRRGRSHGF